MNRLLTLILVAAFTLSMIGCGGDTNINITSQAADGLDLAAVAELIKDKEATSAERLEQLINDQSRGLNNLDLNEDDEVDYVSVKEYGDGSVRGFALYVDLGNNEQQEVADIKIEQKDAQTASVQVQGNTQIYGDNHYYASDFSLSDAILLSWLFRPHPIYMSPYHYGYYPGGYAVYHRVPLSAYRSRVQTVTRTTTVRRVQQPTVRSTVQSPLAGRAAPSVRAPLSSPTESQKSFQVRNPSKSVGSGGFGGSSSSPSASKPSAPSRPSAAPRSAPSRPSASPSRSFGRK